MLVLLSVALSVFLIIKLTREEGSFVAVSVNGEEVCEYSLSRDGEYSLNGGTNILVIENGRAYMRDADCPDRFCVRMGSIRSPGQMLVCLPNQIVVRIVGTGETEVDAVVY